jgi:tetratricopeptide (TPR) repeat protein
MSKPTFVPSPVAGPRSRLGLYRSWLTSPDHRRHITVGRTSMLQDTLETLRGNLGKKPKHHQLFIAPRGSGKTHFLSLIEDEIERDPALSTGYQVVRFPEEANRVCSFADFLLGICEILRPAGPPWESLHDRLAVEEDDAIITDTLTKAIRAHHRETGRVLVLMVENLHQVMEQQIKKPQSIQALRGFLMGDNGCLLIGTAPVHFGAHTKPNAPFYDFFDTQVLEPLGPEDTIDLIRRNLEWDGRQDLLDRFAELRPKLRAIHTMTGGSPRLTVMLYELLSSESITAVKEQFMMLQDRITPFYQDRMRDLSPQERAVLETLATMRDQPGRPAPRKTPANIARLMRMGQPQLSALLGRLTKALYLTSSSNPDDKRSFIYTIREGFFDLWLAMNLSRAAQQRIPLLTDFFASYYEQDEARRLKREEYWQRLAAGEFNADTAENLSYLSTVGETYEQAAEKIKLIPTLHRAGDAAGCTLLKSELRLLPLDPTGRWFSDHAEDFNDNPLDELTELIHCWQTRREGNLEAFARRLRDLGETLDYRGWSTLKMEFLRDHLEAVPVSPDRIEARLRLADVLCRHARWEEAEPQSTTALQEAEHMNDDKLISSALTNHAQLLQATNRFAEAEPLMRRALAIDKASFGPQHPEVARDLNNLAALLKATNRLAEAELHYRRALAILEGSLGERHPNVAAGLNNLAQLLKATNRLAEAEPLMRRVIAILEASPGENHPDVGTSLNNLASLLHSTNRLAEAEPLMRRALGIDEASFGTDHPAVARDLNNLAQLLQGTNRLAEAELLMRRALAIDEASYGPDHPEVAIRLNNLAQLLKATNRLAEAELLMRRALAIDEASFGPQHPEVARVLNNLGLLLQATDRFAAAEPLCRRALAIAEASFGTDHPDVARALNNLGLLLQAANRLAEAEPLYRRALAIDEASCGADHPEVAIHLYNLAQLLKATHRLAEAEPLMRRHVEILLKFAAATSHPHPHLNEAFWSYHSLLTAMGDTAEQAHAKITALCAVHGLAIG